MAGATPGKEREVSCGLKWIVFKYQVVSDRKQSGLPKLRLVLVLEGGVGWSFLWKVTRGASVVVMAVSILWVRAPSCGGWDFKCVRVSAVCDVVEVEVWMLGSLQMASEVVLPFVFTPADLHLQWKMRRNMWAVINTDAGFHTAQCINTVNILCPFFALRVGCCAEVSFNTLWAHWQGEKGHFSVKSFQ